VREAELAERWARAAGAEAIDTAGERLWVRFPGRRWGGPGPDFRGAVLALDDGRVIRGDVEVHRRASGWAAHHHGRDPAYDGVVLHLVQRADVPVHDRAGGPIRTIELPTLSLSEGAGAPSHPCLPAGAELDDVVRRAGQRRLERKAERFARALREAGPDQALWRGVAEALGYTRNTVACGRLAEAVPWARAAGVAASRGPVGLAALLIGSAGLLSASTLAEAHAWRALEREEGARPALSAWDWRLSGVRIGNHPVTRLRGLAELAQRWLADGGPAACALARVRAEAGARRPKLWDLVAVPPLIGRGRAQVIVVNTLLPFALASGLAEARSLLDRLPAEPANRVSRYMAAQLAPAPGRLGIGGACGRQGLLELFAASCAGRVCEGCDARARGQT
jgi:Protein of unknown function (DUF2851)